MGSSVGIDGIGTHWYVATVTPLLPGECASVDSIQVTIQEAPLVSFSTSGEICDGLVQLTANVSNALPGEVFTYDWSSMALPDVQTVNLGPSTGPITYSLRVGSNLRTCVTNADTTFQVNEPIEIILTAGQACDDGQPIAITSQVNTTVTYDWSFNNTSLGLTTADIEVMDEGLYTLTASTDECVAEACWKIVRAPFTEGNLPTEVLICPDDPNPDVNSVLLDPGGNFITYEWVLNGGSAVTDPTFLADQEGTLEVTLTNGFNCVDFHTIPILENCIPRISAPNAFSPNGNAQNDFFSVFSAFVTDFEIFIYNRWGEIVFHSEDKDFGWDGKVNGSPAPVGTYAYVIRFSSEYDISGQTHEQRGGVTLLR